MKYGASLADVYFTRGWLLVVALQGRQKRPYAMGAHPKNQDFSEETFDENILLVVIAY
jgi:hypothetical protein